MNKKRVNGKKFSVFYKIDFLGRENKSKFKTDKEKKTINRLLFIFLLPNKN